MDAVSLGVLPVAVFGAIVGSFLNVVVFRLPRGLSIASPRWSFCPHCEKRVPPQYNVPIFGWLALGGRCRQCRAPISMVYPVVEATTSLVFIMLWDAVVVAKAMPELELVRYQAALFGAYVILFACLLATSAMDLESYSIHIQIPLVATGVGIAAWAVAGLVGNTPLVAPHKPASLLPPAMCWVSLAAGAFGLGSWLLLRSREDLDQNGESPPAPEGQTAAGTADTLVPAAPGGDLIGPSEPVPVVASPPWRFQPVPILLLTAAIAGLMAWQVLAPARGFDARIPAAGQRALAATSILLLVLILASLIRRESDQQIIDDLERERPQARAMASHEFMALLPGIIAGLVMLAWLRQTGRVSATWSQTYDAWPGPLAPHLLGACYGLAGAILSAGLGWTVRILGTMAFRKEAFGSGDIYILAAIGAVGGIWLVVIGFLLAAVLALVGVLATSFRKTSRAIPFGPWLALGAFASLWLQKPLLVFFAPVAELLWSLVTGQPVWMYGA